MTAELVAQAYEQIHTLMYLCVALGAVILGLFVGSRLYEWWLRLPICQFCHFRRTLPGDTMCLICMLESD